MNAEFSGMSERHAGRLADGHGLRFGRSARKGASSCIAALAACGAWAGQLAAEPIVHSPVASDYEERGRMFVVAMIDYSEQENEHLSMVRILKDTDGDGSADERRVVFPGFARSNVQGLVNSLRWTLDCRVHGASSITLNRAENASDTIMRSEIETLSSTGRSIMPEGMEQQIDQQRVAELLTHLPATPWPRRTNKHDTGAGGDRPR